MVFLESAVKEEHLPARAYLGAHSREGFILLRQQFGLVSWPAVRSPPGICLVGRRH